MAHPGISYPQNRTFTLTFFEPKRGDDRVLDLAQRFVRVRVEDGDVDLESSFGREGGPRDGLDVEPKTVLLVDRI